MKINHRLWITILIVLLLAVTLILSAFHPFSGSTASLTASALQSNISLKQIDTDLSEVGSTTGIAIMGIVIVLIVTVPLLLRKKR